MFTIRLFIYTGRSVAIISFLTVSFASPVFELERSHATCEGTCHVRRGDANCESRGLTSALLTGCQGVWSLNLAYNLLHRLSADILPALTSVIKIDFSNNPITHIEPGSFGNNPQLEEIIFSNMRLPRLFNDTFVGLSRLRKLHLWASRLEVLEERSLPGLGSLEEIDLGLNRIRSIPRELFADTVNLEVISLSVNKLTELPSGVFTGLSRLTVLDLASNRLEVIPEDLFNGLTSLGRVDLRRNRLVSVPSINVRYVDLKHNEITSFPFPIGEEDGPRWKDLQLHGNPLHCDYTIEPLRRWYACQRNTSCNGSATVDTWVCGSPDTLEGVKVDQLPSLATTTEPPTTTVKKWTISKRNDDNAKVEEMFSNYGQFNIEGVNDVHSTASSIMGNAVLATLLAATCRFAL